MEIMGTMKLALEALEAIHPGNMTPMAEEAWNKAITALRQAISEAEQAQFVANEVQLNIIRWWPDGFANRLEHVWKDLIGFIPNHKLYDLQRMMAEFGFTMKLYEGDAPPPRQPLTDEEIEDEWERITGHSIFGGDRSEGRAMYISPNEVSEFTRAIEAAHGIGEQA